MTVIGRRGTLEGVPARRWDYEKRRNKKDEQQSENDSEWEWTRGEKRD